MSMASDITERKRVADELQKIEKLESIGIFAGGIAHDLNNFLTSIVSSIELAIMCDDLVEKNEVLATAEKETLKVKGLTQQLITFAKGGSALKGVSNLRSLITDSVSFALAGSNITVTEIKSIVEPDRVEKNIWRESVAFLCIHPPVLPISVS